MFRLPVTNSELVFTQKSRGEDKRGPVTANGHEGHCSCILVPFVDDSHNTPSEEFVIMKSELSITQPYLGSDGSCSYAYYIQSTSV